jgi:hypothetical protein
VIRRKNVKNTIFASVIESHGNYSPVSEFAVNANSNLSKLEVVHDDEKYTAVAITDLKGVTYLFILSNNDPSESGRHQLTINGSEYSWTGPYHYTH